MNCGMCTECKIKIWVFGNFGFLKFVQKQLKVKKIIKNTNCGTYRECKIKNWVFENFGFLKVSKIFRKCSFFSKVFWLFWCFCKGNCNF